jgi:Leucine-rich repeat (LRR) protein
LTGPIPTELGGISTLQYLYLQSNALNGTLPTELGRLQGLLKLDIYYNELSGSLPSQLGSLSSLNRLDLGMNNVTGPIPSELGQLSTLQYLNLGSNALTGTLPTELGSLLSLAYLLANVNHLSGSLPSQLGKLSSLIYLDLLDNRLSGVIPNELLEISTLQDLLLPTRVVLSDKFVKQYKVSIQALLDRSSPQYEALEWILDNHSTDVQSKLSDNELVERFALVLLYFATGGESWLDQAGFLTPLINTCSWNSNGEITSVLGVGCNGEGSVVTLDLCKFPKPST